MNELEIRQNTLPAMSVADMERLGLMFEKSQMFGCTEEGQGAVLVMNCVMGGMTPFEFIRDYHLIKGRPTMKADVMLAKLIERGGDYEIIERSPERAAVKMTSGKRKGEFQMTWEEAKGETYVYDKGGKNLKDNWSTPRRRMQMLFARVTSDGVRAVDPGAVAGTYTPEEVMDFADDRGAAQARPRATVETPPKRGPAKVEKEPEPIEAEYTEEAAEPEPEKEPDYNLIPQAKKAGQTWADLPDELLAVAYKSTAARMTPGHKKAVKAEMDKRAEAKKTEGENDE